VAAVACVLLAGAGFAGCQSSPEPDQMSRTATETAPADLQLLCANAAAQTTGVDGSKVLPVGSNRLDGKTYSVDLNAGGTAMRCTVDDTGNVVSVEKA
jgi:hypothetical protein